MRRQRSGRQAAGRRRQAAAAVAAAKAASRKAAGCRPGRRIAHQHAIQKRRQAQEAPVGALRLGSRGRPPGCLVGHGLRGPGDQ